MLDPCIKKITIFMGALLITAVSIALVVRLLEPVKKISIESIPAQVSVSINSNDKTTRDGVVKLKKGEYTLVFSAKDYKNTTRSLKIIDDFSDLTMSVALDPVKPEVYKDSQENQFILLASDIQTDGLLSRGPRTVATPEGDATVSICQSLHYKGTSAVCVNSPSSSYGAENLKKRIQTVFKNSLVQYEIYYAYNSMAVVHEDDTMRVRYAYTIQDDKPSLYISTNIRNIDEVKAQLNKIGVNPDRVYISFENSEMTQYNSIREGRVDNHGPEAGSLYSS